MSEPERPSRLKHAPTFQTAHSVFPNSPQAAGPGDPTPISASPAVVREAGQKLNAVVSDALAATADHQAAGAEEAAFDEAMNAAHRRSVRRIATIKVAPDPSPLERAARALVETWDEALPHLRAQDGFCIAHGFTYGGPNIANPVEALRRALGEGG